MQKTRYEQDTLQEIVTHFHLYGTFIQAELIGSGHINHTFLLTMDQGGNHVRYILQCINDHVFPKPHLLMENYARVTEHLHKKYKDGGLRDISRRCIQLVHIRHGHPQARQPYFVDTDGHLWRCYLYIERVLCLDKVKRIQHASAAAAAFARFQRDLTDLPNNEEGAGLHPTIPSFHDIRARYEQLEDALAHDPLHRQADIETEIEFYRQRKAAYCVLENMRDKGVLPCRVCHNDTKINNVLIDEHSGEGIAVIDLDTVMNGTILYDFGDLGRTALSNSAEDETDTTRIHARMGYFQAMTEEFLREWSNSLSDIEVDLLAFAPRVMTLIIGLRFLTDYLNGDVYFQTHTVRQNLDRSRAHIALVESMEQQEGAMKQIVVNVVEKLNLKYSNFMESLC